MSQAESNLPPDLPHSQPSPRSRLNKLLSRSVFAIALIAASTFLTAQARELWSEWTELQNDLHQMPAALRRGLSQYRTDRRVGAGAQRLVQSRRQSVITSGTVGTRALTTAGFASRRERSTRCGCTGRRSSTSPQAIDFPLVETKGGKIWRRIPSEAPVVGYKIENLVCVYPVAILGKVLVINDIVDKHPYMIVVNPFACEVSGLFDLRYLARRAPGDAGPHRLFSGSQADPFRPWDRKPLD